MRTTIVVLAVASAACLSVPALAADVGRGKALYEARCNACHKTSVHQRQARRAASFAGIRGQVVRWTAETGGAWSREDIDDVTYYLNDRYYFYPCPEIVCRSAESRTAPAAAAGQDGQGLSRIAKDKGWISHSGRRLG